MNRYYVGAKHIASAIAQGRDGAYTKSTMSEAIEEAKKQVMNGDVECAVVVEIIAVIQREKPPVSVKFLNPGFAEPSR